MDGAATGTMTPLLWLIGGLGVAFLAALILRAWLGLAGARRRRSGSRRRRTEIRPNASMGPPDAPSRDVDVMGGRIGGAPSAQKPAEDMASEPNLDEPAPPAGAEDAMADSETRSSQPLPKGKRKKVTRPFDAGPPEQRRAPDEDDLMQAPPSAPPHPGERAITVEPGAAEPDQRPVMTGYAPTSAKPGGLVLVQAYVHRRDQTGAVRRMAAQRDPDAKSKGADVLALAPKLGDRLTIRLEAPGLTIDEPAQTEEWRGGVVNTDFSVEIPRENWREDYHLKLVVELAGVPIARIRFRLQISADGASSVDELPAATAYDYVFMSYASEQRDLITTHAQVLQSMGIKYFHDVVSLRAGDDWKDKLQEHVNACDLFLLYWSQAASDSEWVRQELAWALETKDASPTFDPEIKPFRLAEDPPADPPAALNHLHFEMVHTAS